MPEKIQIWTIDVVTAQPLARPLEELRSTETEHRLEDKQFPFLVTSNEVRVSKREAARYHLYRVFQFAKEPRL